MLVDHRTYRIKPGKMQAHLDLYEQYGFAAQTRHLGKPLAYMIAESGEINTIVHIWVYEEEKRRGGVSGKPAHQADDAGEIRPADQALRRRLFDARQ